MVAVVLVVVLVYVIWTAMGGPSLLPPPSHTVIMMSQSPDGAFESSQVSVGRQGVASSHGNFDSASTSPSTIVYLFPGVPTPSRASGPGVIGALALGVCFIIIMLA